LEVNLLGLTFGVNPFDFSLKLPLIGRIGPARRLEVGAAHSAPETRAAPESPSAF
jgi:hypothetical protein